MDSWAGVESVAPIAISDSTRNGRCASAGMDPWAGVESVAPIAISDSTRTARRDSGFAY